MPNYKIPVSWTMTGYVTVNADNAHEAMQKAVRNEGALPFPTDENEYKPDSFHVDQTGEVIEVLEDDYISDASDASNNGNVNAHKPLDSNYIGDIDHWNPINTRISYLYRDACNYKVQNVAVVKGLMSGEQQQQILNCLIDGENFIPRMVGLPEQRFGTWTDDDVDWFEFQTGSFEYTCEDPTVDMTIDELVCRFKNAKKRNWGYSTNRVDVLRKEEPIDCV